MLRSHVHLIGGGPGTLTSLRRHLKNAIPVAKGAKAKKPLVAYVGAASGDDAGFLAMIGAEIERAGARVKPVKLASPRAKVSAAKALLEDADVVFVSGGDVEAGMRVLHERDVVPVFRSLASAGRPMIGISAGSIMLGRAWVRFPEDKASSRKGSHAKPASKHEGEVFACMNIAPIHVDAHAEEDDWEELRTLLGLLARDGEPRAVGYGLTKKGGLFVGAREGERGIHAIPFGTEAPKFVLRRGRVVPGGRVAVGKAERLV